MWPSTTGVPGGAGAGIGAGGAGGLPGGGLLGGGGGAVTGAGGYNPAAAKAAKYGKITQNSNIRICTSVEFMLTSLVLKSYNFLVNLYAGVSGGVGTGLGAGGVQGGVGAGGTSEDVCE